MESKEQTPLIETIDLKKYFRVSKKSLLHAVDGINLRIYNGKTLGVVGESGCGKSTLGRSLLRLLEPTSGKVLYNGKDIIALSKRKMNAMRSHIQIIFQDPYSSLNPRMSVFDLIAEFMIVSKIHKSKAALIEDTFRLMELVGLDTRFADSYPHELDGGRRQRIGVARALSLKPEFIVCDEPVSALDVSIQAQILNLLMDLKDNMGLSYMFITHDLSVVKHISNEIMVMYLGKCVELAVTDELFDNPKHPYTKALLAALPLPDIAMRHKTIQIIRGEISNPIDPKPGCRFASRCELTIEECTKLDPELKDLGGGHLVACHLI